MKRKIVIFLSVLIPLIAFGATVGWLNGKFVLSTNPLNFTERGFPSASAAGTHDLFWSSSTGLLSGVDSGGFITTIGPTAPASTDKSIQFNQNGIFGGIAPGAAGTVLKSNGATSTASFQADAGGVWGAITGDIRNQSGFGIGHEQAVCVGYYGELNGCNTLYYYSFTPYDLDQTKQRVEDVYAYAQSVLTYAQTIQATATYAATDAANSIGRDNSKPPTTDISWDSFNLIDQGTLTNLKSQTTNGSVGGTASPSDGAEHTYLVGGYLRVNSISINTITFQVDFTDEGATSRTASFFPQGVTTAAIAATGFFPFPPMIIRVDPGTSITPKTTIVGAGSQNFDVGSVIHRLD